MRYVKPHYYDDFKCIADKCPDTCCAGWQIVIDEDTLEKYENLAELARDGGNKSGTSEKEATLFAARLCNSIDWEEGCFKQYHKRCAMLNTDNLCDLVIEKGEEWLCDTCNRYPRHIEEFDGVREMSLSLSCPVAAEMILTCEEPVHFIVEEDDREDPLEEEFEDFDFLLFTQLEDARNVLFAIAQNRVLSVDCRKKIIIQMAKEMQTCLDEERLFDMETVIATYAKYGEITSDEPEKRYTYLKDNFALFYQLERLREDWTEVVTKTENLLYRGNYEQYTHIYNEFQSEFVTGFGERKWEIFKEQILMFFLYTYFCGAVYDDCIYSKAAMAVFSVDYIQELIMAEWYLTEKRMDMQACIRMAYRYAREVEHSDENLNLLEEWLYHII
ncbi:MAG: flagellin lysine-N-methylase [Bacteroides sp.]|nr:flagellin lysine-N-methylase [Bacteroides sp.]